jgi:uncharacterized phiE125 gp8 family phage protein
MEILNTTPEKTKTGTVASLTELKAQLNIPDEFTDDDTILTALLAAAVESVEDDTRSDLLDTTNVLTHDLIATQYTADTVAVPRLIYINQAPVRAITKVEISTDGNTWTTIAATAYSVRFMFNRVEVRLFDSATAIQIRFTFTSGYTDLLRPKRLKQATILKAADLFDTERSNYIVGAPVFDAKTYAALIVKHVRTYW